MPTAAMCHASPPSKCFCKIRRGARETILGGHSLVFGIIPALKSVGDVGVSGGTYTALRGRHGLHFDPYGRQPTVYDGCAKAIQRPSETDICERLLPHMVTGWACSHLR